MTCETILGIPITERFDKKTQVKRFLFYLFNSLKKHRLPHIVPKLKFV